MLSNRFSERNSSLWIISCKTQHFSKYIGRVFEVVQHRNLVRPNNISILNFYFHLWMATELIMLWSLEMVNIFAIAGTPRPSSEIIIPLQPFITSSAVGNCLVPSLFFRFTNSISLSCLRLFLVFRQNKVNSCSVCWSVEPGPVSQPSLSTSPIIQFERNLGAGPVTEE